MEYLFELVLVLEPIAKREINIIYGYILERAKCPLSLN